MTTQLRNIMLAGTGSDVGKSLIATGLCRIFKQDGYSPAPFKAQNMALNSAATPDGKEIGRAQAVQAEAAGLKPVTDMNPLLLKPTGDHRSQVVLNGVAEGSCDAYEFYRSEGRKLLRREVNAAFHRLASHHNPIVLEGAGSISELNLRHTDLVNMPMAREADADILLVADIDRGGVFASVYGSIMLQSPEDRERIKGIIINKFRGDIRLFDSGRKIMEEICGVPVIGVVPMAENLHIDEEDSMSLSRKTRVAVRQPGKVNIAVVSLGRISNFTDFNSLEHHPLINLFYTDRPEGIAEADIVILPGSKATIADLVLLREKALDKAIHNAKERGASVVGICGGYQMMGMTVSDPAGVEGKPETVEGLGLLPVDTVIGNSKVTRNVTFTSPTLSQTELSEGYEIHMGRTTLRPGASPLNIIMPGETADGCIVDDCCFGTYIHGWLDNDPQIRMLLSRFLPDADVDFNYRRFRDRQYDRLAEMLRENLNIPLIYKILSKND